MQICPHCGKETQDGGFCTACGGAISADQENRLLKSAEANEQTVQFCNKWSKVSMVIAAGFLVLRLISLIKHILRLKAYNDEHRRNLGANAEPVFDYSEAFDGFFFELIPVFIFAAVAFFLIKMAKQMQKSKLSVFTNHVSICCPEKYFKVQQADLKYPDITSSAVSSSFRAQNECVVLIAGGKTYSIPVNEADAMCQLINQQKGIQQ